jgi:malonyl-CoA O-methyltransferase
MTKNNRLNIARNFSRYAHLYDQYADVQMQTALGLVESIKGNNFSKILEIGCGTGNYTLLLRNRFGQARIKALDISEKMIGLARNKLKDRKVEFIVSDAEQISLGEDYDLITSNACFQWFVGLEEVLREYGKLLQKKGAIYFSIFGSQTFNELNTALRSILADERVAAANFYDRLSLAAMLKENFKSVKITEVCYRETLPNLTQLLEKIKYSGIRGNGLSKKIYFSRIFLNKLEEAYLDKFKEICDTYQVFLCQGEKQ